MAEQLTAEVRKSLGKRNNRRLRRAGHTPGILYGHGEENVCLSVPAKEIDLLVSHGNRLVALTGEVDESAFIREVQWDTWGTHVVHVDFTRISEHEKVVVQVAIELRGEAPGTTGGGVVEQLIRQVQLECPAGAIPEKISVSINDLKLHDSIAIGDLDLPADATVVGDTTAVIVQCVEPAVELEEEAAEAVSGEPEVIGAKPEEGETKPS